MSAFQKRD